ncbi:MAG: glyoxalase [Lachnospiraceae bacterium]|nr:glyoxalase [Lachnospiraceae bacterium]
MHEYDDAVLQCFLEKQGQLFSEEVAGTPEEAEAFLSDCMAVVLGSADEVEAFFEEEGMDVGEGSATDADEVFEIGDGRYLVVEG